MNGLKQQYAMKLGEGGEAFFVFETTDEIPASLQTSPLVSPAASPRAQSEPDIPPSLPEPDFFDLEKGTDALSEGAKTPPALDMPSNKMRAHTDLGIDHVFDPSSSFLTKNKRNYNPIVAISR